jgi:hypothetical protein
VPDDRQAQQTREIYREQRVSANAAAAIQASLDRQRMHEVREQQAARR